MKYHPYLEKRLEKLIELCKRHRVFRLYAFGSIVSEAFNEQTSDIDFQVELMPIDDPIEKGLTLLAYWDALEALFERKVDLLTDQPIKNPFFLKNLEKTKVLVYERAGQEVLV